MSRLTIVTQRAAVLIVLAALPIWLMSYVPPMWNFVDSTVQLFYSMSNLVPHFPPLFVGIVRALNFGGPTERSIFLIIAFQHAVFVLAAGFVIHEISNQWQMRILLSCIVLLLGFPLYLFNHGIYSEGLFASSLLILCACTFRFLRKGPSLRTLALLGFACLLVVQLRHVGQLFVFLPLAVVSVHLIAEGALWRGRAHLWRTSIVVAAILAIAAGTLVISRQITRITVEKIGIIDRSIVGRSLVYRYEALKWDSIPDEERVNILGKLSARRDNALATEVLRALLKTKNPWVGTFSEVREIIKQHRPELAGFDAQLDAETDRMLNRFGWRLVLASIDRNWRNIFGDFFTYIGYSNHTFQQDITGVHAGSIELYAKPEMSQTFKKLPRARDGSWALDPRKKKLLDNWGPGSTSYLASSAILFVLALALRLGGALRSSQLAVAATLLIFGYLYFLAVAMLTVVVVRYGVVGSIIVLVTTLYVIGSTDWHAVGNTLKRTFYRWKDA